MQQYEALKVLVQAALKAQGSGILSLDEAVIVKNAIDAFKQETQEEEVTEE